jgi:beta-lactamase class D
MNPELQFEEKYIDWVDNWKQPHNPIKWIKNSCVWYSQILTTKLGMKKFKDYIRKFHYGNQNVSGDKGKNNGLTNSWLSSSLQISPEEQLVFLQKLLANDLPVSQKAHEMTKNILFVEELSDGWKLYGKTGSGSQASKKKIEKFNLQIGWFVGWMQKDNRTVVFVHYIEDKKEQEIPPGLRAKAIAKEKLKLAIHQ